MRTRGAAYEAQAAAWLAARGLELLSSNYSCRGGEIDLVMRDDQTLVFVEVRYRRDDRYGGAAASVDARKQARIIRAARHFLMRHSRYADAACRFDVVAMSGDAQSPRVDWIAGAFSA